MSFYLSQGLRLCWRQTCGPNPAKHSTQQTHLRVALAAAPRPLHGRTGSPYTILPRKKRSMFVLIGKAKNHLATCTMGVQPPRCLL